MHRTDAPDNASNLFTDGVPGTTPATVIDAPWLNDVQENVCQAIEAAGITLVKGTYTQLRDAILALVAATARTFTAQQTMNGASGDTNAARQTSVAPTARKLVDQWNLSTTVAGPSIYARWYASVGGVELTINAAWSGTQWAPDDSTLTAFKYAIGYAAASASGSGQPLVVYRHDASASWADGSWSSPTTGASTWTKDAGVSSVAGNLWIDHSGIAHLSLAAVIGAAGVAAGTAVVTIPAPYQPADVGGAPSAGNKIRTFARQSNSIIACDINDTANASPGAIVLPSTALVNGDLLFVETTFKVAW